MTEPCNCGETKIERCARQTGRGDGDPCPFASVVTVDGVTRTPASSVEAVAIEWLLPGMIPSGTITLLAGVGGLGKSTWTMRVAADLSAGRIQGRDAADVLVLTYEDPASIVGRPRLEAAQAGLDRVHFLSADAAGVVSGEMVTLPTKLDAVDAHIAATGARLLIIDPVVASIAEDLDTFKDQHVRRVLGRLSAIAAERDCAVLIVAHLNKAPSRDAYVRVANSVAFWNAARSVVLVTGDAADDSRLVAQVKANWSKVRSVQRWRIRDVTLDRLDHSGRRIETSCMEFVEDALDVDRGDLLGDRSERDDDERSALEEACDLLRGSLASGPALGSRVLSEARAHGISERTLKRARKALGVTVEKDKGVNGPWRWRLQIEGGQVEGGQDDFEIMAPFHEATIHEGSRAADGRDSGEEGQPQRSALFDDLADGSAA